MGLIHINFLSSLPLSAYIPVSNLKRSLNHPKSAPSPSVSASSKGPKPPKKRILVPMATHVSLSRGEGGTPLHAIFCHCFVSDKTSKIDIFVRRDKNCYLGIPTAEEKD